MNETNIEWVRNPDGSKGFTWNPVTGCLGPAGDGVRCTYCYAHRLANGRLRQVYLRNSSVIGDPMAGRHWDDRDNLVIAGDPADPFAPRYWPKRFNDPSKVERPSRIFVCSQGDLFGDWMPRWIPLTIIHAAALNPQHTFMFLTKWPQNLAKFNWPRNAWVGATADDVFSYLQAEAGLVRVEAPVRFISFEPLLERIGKENLLLYRTDWIIIGAQTGPGAKPVDREAVQELIDAADERDIPVFLKDNLNWHEKRQEWPEGVKA